MFQGKGIAFSRALKKAELLRITKRRLVCLQGQSDDVGVLLFIRTLFADEENKVQKPAKIAR